MRLESISVKRFWRGSGVRRAVKVSQAETRICRSCSLGTHRPGRQALRWLDPPTRPVSEQVPAADRQPSESSHPSPPGAADTLRGPRLQAALATLDPVSAEDVLLQPCHVFRSPPALGKCGCFCLACSCSDLHNHRRCRNINCSPGSRHFSKQDDWGSLLCAALGGRRAERLAQ